MTDFKEDDVVRVKPVNEILKAEHSSVFNRYEMAKYCNKTYLIRNIDRDGYCQLFDPNTSADNYDIDVRCYVWHTSWLEPVKNKLNWEEI